MYARCSLYLGILMLFASMWGPVRRTAAFPRGFANMTVLNRIEISLSDPRRNLIIGMYIFELVSILASVVLMSSIRDRFLPTTCFQLLQLPLLVVPFGSLLQPKDNGWGFWMFSAGAIFVYIATLLPRVTLIETTRGFEVILAQSSDVANGIGSDR